LFVVGAGVTLGWWWSTIVVAGVEIVESLGQGAWWWRGDVSSHDFSYVVVCYLQKEVRLFG
jgi:hypothetical protein